MQLCSSIAILIFAKITASQDNFTTERPNYVRGVKNEGISARIIGGTEQNHLLPWIGGLLQVFGLLFLK